MERYDVVIVGGGPAGSSCAWRLRQRGLDVLVIDKKIFPRHKVCAGWITPAVMETLHMEEEEYRRGGRVLQAIHGFRTGRLGGHLVDTNYDQDISYGIRRCEFDHYLLQRCDARLRLGEPLRSLTRANGHWLINEQIETTMLVGAGGHFCPIARHLGAKPGRSEPAVTAQEIEFEMDQDQLGDCCVTGDMPELYFCSDLKGYGWCFRKGNFLNVGLGREGSHNLSRHVDDFSEFLISAGRIPRNIPQKFNGHAYLLYSNAARQLIADGVLLIGDAAGLAYPQSGEGIRPAIESGIMAADTIAAAAGVYKAEQLHAYKIQLSQRFGPRQVSSAGFERWLPPSWKQTIAASLLATHWFSRHVVLDRWFLHSHEKPLQTPLSSL